MGLERDSLDGLPWSFSAALPGSHRNVDYWREHGQVKRYHIFVIHARILYCARVDSKSQYSVHRCKEKALSPVTPSRLAQRCRLSHFESMHISILLQVWTHINGYLLARITPCVCSTARQPALVFSSFWREMQQDLSLQPAAYRENLHSLASLPAKQKKRESIPVRCRMSKPCSYSSHLHDTYHRRGTTALQSLPFCLDVNAPADPSTHTKPEPRSSVKAFSKHHRRIVSLQPHVYDPCRRKHVV